MKLAGFAAVAALAVSAIPSQAVAQTDGQVSQALANTVAAHLQRRGYEIAGPVSQQTLNDFHAAVGQAAVQGGAATSSPDTWQQVLKGLADWGLIAHPSPLGGSGSFQGVGSGLNESFEGYGGGSFGGGGAGGSWDFEDYRQCSMLDLRFDISGNLIIPSFTLMFGQGVTVGGASISSGAPMAAIPCLTSVPSSGNPCGTPDGTTSVINKYIYGFNGEAAFRRALHLGNMAIGYPQGWFGVIGPDPANPDCVQYATVAHKDPNGLNVARREMTRCGVFSAPGGRHYDNDGHGHKSCPEGESGGDFHYYGDNWRATDARTGNHWDRCHMYYPNPQLSPDGYAINPYTSLPWDASALTRLPPFLQDCALSPELIRKMADALLKRASLQPGYTGAPYEPVQDTDVRPGDTTVRDLSDDPNTGTTNPPPDDGVNEPPPSTGGGSTGGGDECDFGAGGCDNPNTPGHNLEETPTGIMDPIFDWLPDLPSITFDPQTNECPHWAINLTEFGGPEWQFLFNKHCELLADPDVLAMINVLMIALFGIGAAMIILRA